MRSPTILIAFAILTATTLPTHATTHRVLPDGTGDLPTIQAAVDAAQDQDVIELADGVFTGDGNRDVVINAKSLTIASQSGNAAACIIDAQASPDSEHFIFSVDDGVGHVVTFSGLTLTNAWRPPGRITLAGGAIVGGGAQIHISSCVFRNNHAGYGGAVALGAGSHVIDGCTFEANTAPVEGGAIYMNTGDVVLTSSVVMRNTGKLGGALFALDADCTVANCTIVENVVTGNSALIHARTGATFDISNTIIAFNTGPAVVCLTESLVTIQCSDVYGNTGGDYVDCIAGQEGVQGNISADPWFCGPGGEDYTLAYQSPCAPESNPECGLIGALPPACEVPATVLVRPDGTGDYPDIQTAVQNVISGGEVVLGDGVFTGPGNRDIDLAGKPLRIASQSGDPASCIIDCEAQGSGFLVEDNAVGVTLEGLAIVNGSAETGGALAARGSTLSLRNCVFADCAASDRGGALYLNDVVGEVDGCVFIGNQAAAVGGGLFSLESTVTVQGCTFYENAAGDQAAGIWSNRSSLTIASTIVAGSLAGDAVHWNEGAIPELSCCNLYGNAGGDWVGGIAGQLGQDGNISADPVFCDPAARDLHLRDDSPCAPDAGGGCGLIGALPVGCIAVTTLAPVPTEHEPIACDGSALIAFRCLPASTISGIRSYSVRITATEQVAFAASDIAVATLPPGATAIHQIVTHGPNDLQVDYSILGADTPGITEEADLFTVVFHGASDGEALITIAGADLRDLDNQSVPVEFGQTASFVVDCGPPEAVTGLVATPGHRRIALAWQDPGDPYLTDVKIIRGRWEGPAGESAYPLYDRLDGNSTPTRPASLDEALADPRWTELAIVAPGVMAFEDTISARGIYFYEVFARNGVGQAGPPASEGAAATSYILGDVVHDGGDGLVDILDVTALGDAYSTTDGDPAFAPEVDYGPTSDASGAGLPLPDGQIGFEDLVIIGLNFGIGTRADRDPVTPTPASFAWADLGAGRYALRLLGGRGVMAVRVGADAGPGVTVAPGQLVADQAAPVFLRNAGLGLDAGLCALGGETGIVGTGELVVVNGAGGEIAAQDLRLDVRGVDGSSVEFTIAGVVTAAPTPDAYRLEGIYPNPFNPATTIPFALPEAGPVRLLVYGVDGRLVATLVDEVRPAGVHQVVWRGADDRGRGVASGAYFCRLEAGGYGEVGKVVLMR